MLYRLRAKLVLPITKEEAWNFISNPENLKRITPSNMNFTIIYGADEALHEGQIIKYKVSPFPFYKTSWVSEIAHVRNMDYFIDQQLQGPYTLWHHKHKIIEVEGGTLVEDMVYYSLPLGILGKMAHQPIVKKQLRKIFEYREACMKNLFGVVENQPAEIIFD